MAVAPAVQAAGKRTPVSEAVIETPTSALAVAHNWESGMCWTGWLHQSCSIPRREPVSLTHVVAIANVYLSSMSLKTSDRKSSDLCDCHHPMM